MVKSIFISKNASEIVALQQFADGHSIHLKAASFLQFKPVSFDLPRTFDVVFFGSPRAVTFFQSRYSIPKGVLVASVGGKTSALLKSMGYSVSFNGEGKGSISDVAKSFQDWLGERKALFPVSTRSLGTISKGLPSHQAIHVACYETQIVERELSDSFDVYVFTSPSNVEGFFAQNQLPKKAKVIAWGESTAKALNETTEASVTVLDHPSQEELISVLQTI